MKWGAVRAVLSGYLYVRRYLPAPVNILFWVAVIASAVGTAAMILILSVFAGFGELVETIFSSFYPDVRVELPAGASKEKLLTSTRSLLEKSACVKEKQAVLQYGNRQTVVQLLEVDSAYWQMAHMDSFLHTTFQALGRTERVLILGTGVAYLLDIESNRLQPYIRVLLPDTSRLRDALTTPVPRGVFTEEILPVGGLFSIQRDIDLGYAIVVTRSPLQDCPVLYLRAKNEQVITRLAEATLGSCPECAVSTRYQQHSLVYKVLRVERLAVAAIMGGVFLLCLFTIGALVSVLVVVKKPDIKILRALGMEGKDVSAIFTGYGTTVGITGMLAGLVLGLGLAWIQKKFGVVKLAGETFVVKDYPVAFSWGEYVLVCAFVTAAVLALSWIAGRRATTIKPTFREL